MDVSSIRTGLQPIKILTVAIIVGALLVGLRAEDGPPLIKVSTFGKQPTLTVDATGDLNVAFGEGNSIFYTQSTDGGKTFSSPEKVGEQEQLALGVTRGPQIVSIRDYLIIAAADHTGRIVVYQRKRGESEWSKGVDILKGESTAKEGFVAIAAGKNNDVHAAWLDLRIGQHNNIFGASSKDGGQTWSESKLIYASPDGKVCPCCRPSVAADRKGNVYVMFRNDFKGARDLYLAHSGDGGMTFAPAEKLGTGTWMFDKCPMDGGGLSISPDGHVGTAWRRDNSVFYAEPGKPEQKIAEGKAPALVKTSGGNYLAWQEGNEIMVMTPDKITPQLIGSGIYPRLAAMPKGGVICMWESDGQIVAKKLL
jgi:hypothetical protein